MGLLSFKKNPDQNWRIGYSETDTLDPYRMQPSTFADTSRLIPLWHPASGNDNYYPYTGQNTDSASHIDVSQRWALRAHQIAMEGSNNGQYSMLQFTCPSGGKYHVKVIFEGVHFGLSTTDVHVLLNSKSLFNDIIDGYGGDPFYHEPAGSHPSTTFENIIYLNKGDLLTFAVGYGPNKTHFNDTTGLTIVLEQV